MTKEEFDRAADLTQIDQKMREAARLVLVERGISQAEAARRLAVTRQAVSKAVKKVAEAANACPCCGRSF